jgi:hypothetical protein
MNQTKMTKKMFESEPSGTREVRGPILRWLEDEENYLFTRVGAEQLETKGTEDRGMGSLSIARNVFLTVT